MNRKHLPLVFFIIFIVIIGFAIKSKKQVQDGALPNTPNTSFSNSYFEKDIIRKFTSDADFINLMSTSQNRASGRAEFSAGDALMTKSMVAPQAAIGTNESGRRVSETNVQVMGIDEPDIVKTDATSIYYSKEGQYRYYNDVRSSEGIELQMMPSNKMMPPQYQQTNEIVTVGALPPSQMKMRSTIPYSGEMLISGNVMVIFTSDEAKGSLLLVGYSITNPNAPKKLWEVPFSSKLQKVAARLLHNTIYLVTSTSPTLSRPCPLPLIEGKSNMSIRCTDVYMPSSKPISDTVYTVLRINPKSGVVEKTISFIGQAGQSTVYMSNKSLYLSYQVEGNSISILNQFITENRGIFPQYIEMKIKKLNDYDLSQSTKEIEANALISQYIYGMEDNERLKQENQLNNAFKHFFTKYKRSFEYTGIVKVNVADLSVQATGKVPGYTLNQFSFDEWKGNLRVATTIGGRNPFYQLGGNNVTEQTSDVYVLGENLGINGSVKDLGKTERIYSVRFIEDRGYVVTFRQTDPFYVLDLSNVNSPLLKGELKIPGYSSYLHPLDTHLVLGIGRENEVKLSLFDVKDPSNPKEVSHYDLAGEYYSEAMDNHHAFLQDKKYSVFFLPGSRGGYVFSYDANTLSLVRALESPTVKRGLYINDYLYIISDTGITSYREGTWDKAGDFFYEKKAIPVEPDIYSVQPTPTRLELENAKRRSEIPTSQ